MAVERIKNHPMVTELLLGPVNIHDCKWVIEVNMRVELPRDAIDRGMTTTGVKAIEWVRIEFPTSFPSKAPRFLLRADFNRAHPHINPGMPGDLVYPCIYEGSLDELLHETGWIDCLVDQMADWLCKAAVGELMNCTGQGWEPIRRDGITGHIVVDASAIRARLAKNKNPECNFLPYEYFSFDGTSEYSGRIVDENKLYRTMREANREIKIGTFARHFVTVRLSIALIVWGGTQKSVDDYLPDNVNTLAELLDRASEYGCRLGLEIRLKEIIENITTRLIDEQLDIAVVFVVKRPCNLIGEESDLEVIPYRVVFTSDQNRNLRIDRVEISPLGQIQKLNRNLLAQVSGRKPTKIDKSKEIVLVGCGSLGSKIVEHLARAGHGPFKLYDKDCFSPHNSARHAVANRTAAEFMLPKSWLTAGTLQQLGASVREIKNPFEDVITALQQNPKLFARTGDLIIDATASSSVQDALCSVAPNVLGAPLLRSALYGRGQIGFFGLEGKDRNPRIDDLTTQLYQLGLDTPALGKPLYEFSEFDRLSLGQGCASYTMKISDARISQFAAGIAERISRQLDHGLPTEGELLVGMLSEEGMGVTWAHHTISQVEVIHLNDDECPWELRIPLYLKQQMQMESNQRQPSETGGVLIGHINWSRRTIYVSSLLPPPEDSLFSANQFVLGTKGLRNAIASIEKYTGGTLTYLGTWHSHPNGGEASLLDRKTLVKLAEERGRAPSVCLIYGPDGLHAVPGPVTLKKDKA